MITPLCIDHIVLRTSQLQKMIDFYCDVLGCSLERQTAPGFGLTQLRAGSSLIDLVDVDSELGKLGGDAPGRYGNNMDHFCLQIAPIAEETLKHLFDAAGIPAGEILTRNGAEGFGPSLYIRDPDENQVELRSRLVSDQVND